MTKRDILNKAIYICYPLDYDRYVNYNVEGKTIHRLPLPPKGMMYDRWPRNENHFINPYHRKYSLPLLEKLLKFGYKEDDFFLQERYSGGFDISMLHPKKKFSFDVYGYNRGEYKENITFDELIQGKEGELTEYHLLYRYPHECSRIINKDVDSNRILLVSGDSQMIPDISVLACYFKEVWYFDNRANVKAEDILKEGEFTDILIELNGSDIKQYTETNISNKENLMGNRKTIQKFQYYY